jgi:hypothetical protein
MELMN